VGGGDSDVFIIMMTLERVYLNYVICYFIVANKITRHKLGT